MKYGNGKAGAVNGMRPNGEIDETSMQSEEMWVGIANSLASLMIYEVNKFYFSITSNHLFSYLNFEFLKRACQKMLGKSLKACTVCKFLN